MPVAIAAVAVAISAASAAYSAYSQAEAADEQRDAMAKQQEQEKQAAAVNIENQRREAKAVTAQQQSQLAMSGVKLGEEGTTGVQLSKDIEADLNRNIGYTNLQTQWNVENLEDKKNMLPSAGSLALGAGLSFASSALSTYSSYQSSQASQNLLSRQVTPSTGGGSTFSTGQFGSTSVNSIGSGMKLQY